MLAGNLRLGLGFSSDYAPRAPKTCSSWSSGASYRGASDAVKFFEQTRIAEPGQQCVAAHEGHLLENDAPECAC
jgi:hypothetical protein